MRKLQLSIVGMSAVVATALATAMYSTPASAAKWECSAKNLKNFSYRGGKKAMIHLSPYSSGGRYTVTEVSETKVVGKTKDGTSFTCVKK